MVEDVICNEDSQVIEYFSISTWGGGKPDEISVKDFFDDIFFLWLFSKSFFVPTCEKELL